MLNDLMSGKVAYGKQCRPRSDAAEFGIWSGSALFSTECTEIQSIVKHFFKY